MDPAGTETRVIYPGAAFIIAPVNRASLPLSRHLRKRRGLTLSHRALVVRGLPVPDRVGLTDGLSSQRNHNLRLVWEVVNPER